MHIGFSGSSFASGSHIEGANLGRQMSTASTQSITSEISTVAESSAVRSTEPHCSVSSIDSQFVGVV